MLLIGTSGGLGDPLGPMVQSDGCLTALCALPGLDIVEAGDINTATVIATAGALREVALEAAELLHAAHGDRARVLEIVSPTRAARLSPTRRAELFPPAARRPPPATPVSTMHRHQCWVPCYPRALWRSTSTTTAWPDSRTQRSTTPRA
ncbi:hypothetical protein [Amycolatopsis magusensis]|uniref:hypothetical protein n=1 Tax=Amycolatopsis magusensis TaxID=882444 RepID=UPI0037BB18FC